MLSFDSERGFAGAGEGDMEMTRPGREPNFGAVMGLYIAAISMLAMYGCGQELIEAYEFTFEKLPSDAVSDVGVTDSTVPGDVSTSVDGAVQAEVVADASVTDTASSSDTSGGPVATVEQPLAGGEKHSCQIHEDATVVCWGSNDDGQQ